MAYQSTKKLHQFILNSHHDDIGGNTTAYVVAPCRGRVDVIYIASHVAEDSTGPCALTAKITGTAITGGTGTLAEEGVAGTVVTITPTALNTFQAGDTLELLSDGGGGAGIAADITWLCSTT